MLIKVHSSYRKVVAICDAELLGKCFEEGKKILDVRESFYNGEKLSESEMIERIRAFDDATFNIVGKKAIKAGIKAGLVSKKGIGKVKGVPFALTF